jgi:thiamine pyrophosphokinase
VVALPGASPASLAEALALCRGLARIVLLVAVDGGILACRRSRRRPHLYVGDGDSAGRVPRDIPAIVLPRDKDFSDLAGALAELHRRGVRVVVVAGLVGGRLDHEWANLLELGHWARRFTGFLARTERGTVIVTGRGCRLATVPGGLFSLLALGGGAVVTLTGARWTLRRGRLVPGSRGLSNLAGRRVALKVHRGAVALVLPRIALRSRFSGPAC